MWKEFLREVLESGNAFQSFTYRYLHLHPFHPFLIHLLFCIPDLYPSLYMTKEIKGSASLNRKSILFSLWKYSRPWKMSDLIFIRRWTEFSVSQKRKFSLSISNNNKIINHKYWYEICENWRDAEKYYHIERLYVI